MMTHSPPTYLAEKNPHERDSHILLTKDLIFIPLMAKAIICPLNWNHSHFPHFNADKIIEKMMKSRNWSNSKYHGMTKQEIKDQWNENGRVASEAEPKCTHIECFTIIW